MTYQYTYDNSGQKIKQVTITNGKKDRETNYKYDKKDRLINKEDLDKNGKLFGYLIHQYSVKSDTIFTEIKHSPYDDVCYMTTIKNSFGDVIEYSMKTKEKAECISRMYRYEYDSFGNWIQQKLKGANYVTIRKIEYY